MTEFLAEALVKEVEYGIQELVFDFAAYFVILFQFGSVSVIEQFSNDCRN